MKYKFINPQFVKSVVKPGAFPSFGGLPEIALVGRSNVGKSSLLNHLFKRKNVVKTSSTPGKTQAVNFFHLDNRLIFADLPGYGYAKVPLKEQKKWAPLVESYLTRPQLILLLLDIRRIPNSDDIQIFQWIEIPTILILTKADKIKRSQRKQQTQRILKFFEEKSLPYVHYSIVKNEGRNQLIHLICEALS